MGKGMAKIKAAANKGSKMGGNKIVAATGDMDKQGSGSSMGAAMGMGKGCGCKGVCGCKM